MRRHQVAVLGGGISGCLTACLLADEGVDAVIVEPRPELMSAASLWNDGKIHLGYTFQGTPSLATTALMQRGAAVFLPILEHVVGTPLPAAAFGDPVIYVVDADSLVDAETLWSRARQVAGMLTDSLQRLPGLARYMAPGTPLERLDAEVASRDTGQRGIVAGWQTTEVHVSARAVAGLVRAAVAQRGIPVVIGRAERVGRSGPRWHVAVGDGEVLEVDAVVNCTWEGRATLDRQVVAVESPVSIRFKHCMFGRASALPDGLRSSTRILGRFGDVAIYGSGEVYLSWYPAGLVARSDDGVPPEIPPLDAQAMVAATLRGLGLTDAEGDAHQWQVGGGYVVAYGHGDIDSLDSPLHDRSRPAVTELAAGYFTVDTGKYTLGPMLAERAARSALERLEHPTVGRVA